MEDLPPRLIAPSTLRRLLAHLERTDVVELEVTAGSSRLFLRREPGMGARGHDASTAVEASARAPAGQPVVAPLTGVLYLRPSPEQAPFINVGDGVHPGQVVALIETMKLFNEVTVDIAGVVLSLPVQEGALVEAGQPLMFLQPVTEEGEMP